MNEQEPIVPNTPAGGDQLEELLQLAGPRAEVAVERSRRVCLAVREEWRGAIRNRQRRTRLTRILWGLAPAAALALAVGLSLRPQTPEMPAVPAVQVATVDVAIGSARIERQASEQTGVPRALQATDAIHVGELIAVGADALTGLELADGRSLRLKSSTRLRFESPTVIWLEEGTLFFDSGSNPGDPSDIQIRTSMGTVYEIGTQFEVMRAAGDLRVRVREGVIDLERGSRRHRAEVGGELLLAKGEPLRRQSVPVYGPEWDWILALSPRFELEDRPLGEFLEWVSRETGWTMELSERARSASTLAVTLHGSIEGLRPDQALEAVLPTCDLAYRIDDGTVLIDLAS